MIDAYVGWFTPDLCDDHCQYFPLGVVVREDETVVVRLIERERIPPSHQPNNIFAREIFEYLEDIFHNVQQPSRFPTNLCFTVVPRDALKGATLAERADKLFTSVVLPPYLRLEAATVTPPVASEM